MFCRVFCDLGGFWHPTRCSHRMITVRLVFYILALICFALAAIGVNTRINAVAAGLFCWLLGAMVG